jgi:hypothetical protein
MTEPLGIVPTSGDASRTPGETLEMLATWALPESPGALEARLFWFTRGKGTEDVCIVATESLMEFLERGERRVRFSLPEAPYSFSGTLITLTWAVELVADGSAVRWEFTLAPDGKEILLGTASHARLR